MNDARNGVAVASQSLSNRLNVRVHNRRTQDKRIADDTDTLLAMFAYLQLLRTYPHFLGFGVLLCASASFGQTWFISLFGGEIRAAFSLSHGDFGAIYSAATLASGVSLVWVDGF